MKPDGLQTAALAIYALSMLAIAASSAHFARIEAVKIPMQWGIDGQPTWFASRAVGLWWMLYFAAAFGLGLIAFAYFLDRSAATGLWFLVMGFSAICAGIQLWHLNAVAKWAANS
jgi:hypothetical protein